MISHQNSLYDKNSLNNKRNKSKNKILKKTITNQSLYSKTQEETIKKVKLEQQKTIPKIINNKRNLSGFKTISSTTICTLGTNKSNIKSSFLNHNIGNNPKIFHLNEKNKKIISLKTLKKHILMGPLIVPNSILYSHNENKNNNNMKINKNISLNNKFNIYNNYLSHKNSSSEVNTIFKYNNSNSNCNTTANTFTNSNNKSNSFHKSILKKKIRKYYFL